MKLVGLKSRKYLIINYGQSKPMIIKTVGIQGFSHIDKLIVYFSEHIKLENK